MERSEAFKRHRIAEEVRREDRRKAPHSMTKAHALLVPVFRANKCEPV